MITTPSPSLLTALTNLNVESNSLTGNINFITTFSSLISLQLDSNCFLSTIPTLISRLTALTTLSMSSNSLTGAIPSQLFKLTLLSSLILNDNRFNASIHATVGNMTKLAYLDLDSNSLSGPPSYNNLNIYKLTTL